MLIGPDSRLWHFSSNPNIHDHDLVVHVLSEFYKSPSPADVDESLFGERVREITEHHGRSVAQLVRAVCHGELRRPKKLTD